MPIQELELVGKWNKSAPKYGFDNKDIGILTSQKANAKIRRAFEKCDHNFNFYFARVKHGKSLLMHGEMSDENVRQNFDLPNYESDQDAINIVFTQNLALDRVPMTAWTIAHRIGHLFYKVRTLEYMTKAFDINFNKITTNYSVETSYFGTRDYQKCGFANTIGTMRSARMNKITRSGEFTCECIAQSIITGKVKFKPLGRSVIVRRRFAWGNPCHEYVHLKQDCDLEYVNNLIENLAEITHSDVDMCLHGLYGTTLVM